MASILLSIQKHWGDLATLSSWDYTTSPCSWDGSQRSAAKVVTGILLTNARTVTQAPASINNLRNFTNRDPASMKGPMPPPLPTSPIPSADPQIHHGLHHIPTSFQSLVPNPTLNPRPLLDRNSALSRAPICLVELVTRSSTPLGNHQPPGQGGHHLLIFLGSSSAEGVGDPLHNLDFGGPRFKTQNSLALKNSVIGPRGRSRVDKPRKDFGTWEGFPSIPGSKPADRVDGAFPRLTSTGVGTSAAWAVE